MLLKSKVHVAQNCLNLEKRPPFLQFSSKLSDFFLVKDLTNCLLLFLLVSFRDHIFFGQDATTEKQMTSFSTPQGLFFIIFNQVLWSNLSISSEFLGSGDWERYYFGHVSLGGYNSHTTRRTKNALTLRCNTLKQMHQFCSQSNIIKS